MEATDPLQRIVVKLNRLGKIDASTIAPLMGEWQAILVEDNRKGVLEGTDRDGNPLPATTYRTSSGTTTAARPSASSVFGTRDRSAWKAANKAVRDSRGKGVFQAHGNLSTAAYKELTGPPLAPRGEGSRVITHYKTATVYEGGYWQAVGFWDRVLSRAGVAFLPFHFRGEGRNPRRNLVGVRPWGLTEARKAAMAWARALLASES